VAALADAVAPAAVTQDPATAHRTYVAPLLSLLREGIAAFAAAAAAAAAEGDCDCAALCCLPWLVARFSGALAAHRRTAEVAAALAQQDGGRPWEQAAGGEGGEAAAVGGVSRSADFHFYSCMLHLAVAPLAPAGEPGRPAPSPAAAAQLLR
jgi:hypothetical protein